MSRGTGVEGPAGRLDVGGGDREVVELRTGAVPDQRAERVDLRLRVVRRPPVCLVVRPGRRAVLAPEILVVPVQVHAVRAVPVDLAILPPEAVPRRERVLIPVRIEDRDEPHLHRIQQRLDAVHFGGRAQNIGREVHCDLLGQPLSRVMAPDVQHFGDVRVVGIGGVADFQSQDFLILNTPANLIDLGGQADDDAGQPEPTPNHTR